MLDPYAPVMRWVPLPEGMHVGPAPGPSIPHGTAAMACLASLLDDSPVLSRQGPPMRTPIDKSVFLEVNLTGCPPPPPPPQLNPHPPSTRSFSVMLWAYEHQAFQRMLKAQCSSLDAECKQGVISWASCKPGPYMYSVLAWILLAKPRQEGSGCRLFWTPPRCSDCSNVRHLRAAELSPACLMCPLSMA